MCFARTTPFLKSPARPRDARYYIYNNNFANAIYMLCKWCGNYSHVPRDYDGTPHPDLLLYALDTNNKCIIYCGCRFALLLNFNIIYNIYRKKLEDPL